MRSAGDTAGGVVSDGVGEGVNDANISSEDSNAGGNYFTATPVSDRISHGDMPTDASRDAPVGDNTDVDLSSDVVSSSDEMEDPALDAVSSSDNVSSEEDSSDEDVGDHVVGGWCPGRKC